MRFLPQWPLRSWLILSHGGVLIAPVLVLLGSGALFEDLQWQTEEDLKHQGALLTMLIESEVLRARHDDKRAGIRAIAGMLNPTLQDAKAVTRSGIQVVDTRGRVVATSGRVLGQDLSAYPEIVDALNGNLSSLTRPRPEPTERHAPWSESRNAKVRVFVALPVVVDEEVIGAILLSRTPRDQLKTLYDMGPGVGAAIVVAVVAAMLLGAVAAWVATRSLRLLGRGAERIAEGDFRGLADLARPSRSHLVEVAHTATALTTMTERLRDRLSYIAEFASNVSHEFKTPIATLRGTVELMSDDDEMPLEQRARFLANASRELDRLERMVSGLLSLARADEEGARQEVDLQELVDEAAARQEVAVSGQAAPVSADRGQLEAVLKNLVENARRHGGPEVRVTLEAFTEGRLTGFRVRDTGQGISPANLERVFDRFFTTDRARGGTGLGLALVRAIVERHGGQVTVQSQPGDTVFTVTLPRSG
jgi:signal transduction histidine kinase